MHSYDITTVIDLSTGAGNMALTCIRQRKPYFGITLTPQHTEHLLSWLVHQTWLSFLDESCKLYIPELAKIMEEPAGKKDDDPVPKPKAKAKGAAKPKPKSKPEAKPEKPEAKPEAKPEGKPEGKPEAKGKNKAKAKVSFYVIGSCGRKLV